MTDSDNAKRSLEDLRLDIDRRLHSLTSSAITPLHSPQAQVELADLIDEYDRQYEAHAADLRRIVSELHAATAPLIDRTDTDDLRRALCAGAADIAVDATVRLVDIRECAAAAHVPEVFTHRNALAFRIDMAGRPQAALLVEGFVGDEVADALASYAQLSGAILESAALSSRDERQLALLANVPGLQHIPIESGHERSGASADHCRRQPSAPLTVRENEILALVRTGKSNGDIADELVVSVETIRSHVKKILRKYAVSNRAELIALLG